MTWLLRVFGALLLLTALSLPLLREPDRPLQGLVARWAPPPSDFVELHGQLVHLRDEGPPAGRDAALPPLVLLHGTSASLHTWEGWVRALRGSRRVITLDLPGFGLTGPFTGGPDARYPAGRYDPDRDARFVLDLLDHLGVQRFAIGGNSLGGDVAWRVAALAPERVDRLLLVDAAGPPFTPGTVPLAWHAARIPPLAWAMESMLPRALVAQGLHGVYADPSRIAGPLVDRYHALTLREGNRRALVERIRQWQPGAGAERIATLRLPTQVLWGGRDRLIPVSVGQAFVAAIPGSRLVVLPDLGHVPQEEDPAASLAAVRDFLDGR